MPLAIERHLGSLVSIIFSFLFSNFLHGNAVVNVKGKLSYRASRGREGNIWEAEEERGDSRELRIVSFSRNFW